MVTILCECKKGIEDLPFSTCLWNTAPITKENNTLK